MKKFFGDIVNQVWTLLGMFVAWIVLEGSAKTFVGYAIIGTTLFWIVTYKVRNDDD